ncbi:hypothetical protein C0J52_07883 [Blattella germanica]|nr:hypothetical protein C0J52_07883 [Blattella germanica]
MLMWNFIPWRQEMLLGMENGLLFVIMCTMLVLHIWMFHGFTAHRRKLTKLAKLLPGPMPVSLLGNINRCLGNSETLLKKMVAMTNEYPLPMRMWLGPKLIVVLDNPDDIEVILTHPKSQRKDKIYKLMEPYIGNGLITSSETIMGTKMNTQNGDNSEYLHAAQRMGEERFPRFLMNYRPRGHRHVGRPVTRWQNMFTNRSTGLYLEEGGGEE